MQEPTRAGRGLWVLGTPHSATFKAPQWSLGFSCTLRLAQAAQAGPGRAPVSSKKQQPDEPRPQAAYSTIRIRVIAQPAAATRSRIAHTMTVHEASG